MMGMLTTKATPLSIIRGLRPIQSASRPGNQSRDDAAQQNRGDDDRKLSRVQVRSRFEIRQRAADDADVDAVQQAAEARHQQKNWL